MESKPRRSVVIWRLRGKLLPYPAAEPRGLRFVTFHAACRYCMSSTSPSAYAPNQSPKLLGMATCRCVYPGMSTCLYRSDCVMSSSKRFLTRPAMSFIWSRMKSLRSTSTWSLRLRPECIFLPMSPSLRVSIISTCECTSSTPSSISNSPMSAW